MATPSPQFTLVAYTSPWSALLPTATDRPSSSPTTPGTSPPSSPWREAEEVAAAGEVVAAEAGTVEQGKEERCRGFLVRMETLSWTK